MTERFLGASQFRTYDIGIKAWQQEAEKILNQYGPQAIVGYPAVVPIKRTPLFTTGAYTCYAGVVQSPTSGLFLFHLFEDNARATLSSEIGGDPVSGIFGGITLKQKRKNPNEFAHLPVTELQPKNHSLGGFNILALPSREYLYSAGRFDMPE